MHHVHVHDYDILSSKGFLAMMYGCWLAVTLLILLDATDNVYSAHFRGAVIMVKPKFGGAANEV